MSTFTFCKSSRNSPPRIIYRFYLPRIECSHVGPFLHTGLCPNHAVQLHSFVWEPDNCAPLNQWFANFHQMFTLVWFSPNLHVHFIRFGFQSTLFTSANVCTWALCWTRHPVESLCFRVFNSIAELDSGCSSWVPAKRLENINGNGVKQRKCWTERALWPSDFPVVSLWRDSVWKSVFFEGWDGVRCPFPLVYKTFAGRQLSKEPFFLFFYCDCISLFTRPPFFDGR